MVPSTSWTEVKTAGTSQGHLQRNLGSCLPTLRLMGVPPHEGSGASTCQNWDLHNCHPKEDRNVLKDSWPQPSLLLLMGDAGRAVHLIGKPLIAMTTGHQRLSYHRILEPRDPRPLAWTLHDGHADLVYLDTDPEHIGVPVHPAPSGLSAMEGLLGQGSHPQSHQSMMHTATHYSWNPDVIIVNGGVASFWWPHHGTTTVSYAARGELALCISSKSLRSSALKCDIHILPSSLTKGILVNLLLVSCLGTLQPGDSYGALYAVEPEKLPSLDGEEGSNMGCVGPELQGPTPPRYKI